MFEFNGKRRFIVADFYCHKAKLIIELDGGIHEKQKDYDKMRDRIVEILGLKVLRVKNSEVDRNISDVLGRIKSKIMSS